MDFSRRHHPKFETFVGRLNRVGPYFTAQNYNRNDQLTDFNYGNGIGTTIRYDPQRLWIDTVRVVSPLGSGPRTPASIPIYLATYHRHSARLLLEDEVLGLDTGEGIIGRNFGDAAEASTRALRQSHGVYQVPNQFTTTSSAQLTTLIMRPGETTTALPPQANRKVRSP